MKKFFSIVGSIALYFVALLVFTLFLKITVAASSEGKAWLLRNQGVIMIGTSSIAFGCLHIFLKLRRTNTFGYLGFRALNPKCLPILVFIGIFLGLFSTSFVNVPFVYALEPGLKSTIDSIIGGEFVIIALIGPVILGSFIEEVLFRGVVLNELRGGVKPSSALLMHGILFTAVYGFISGSIFIGIYAALGAMIFGLLYLWMNSLWAAVVAHVASSTSLLVLGKLTTLNTVSSGMTYIAFGSFVFLMLALFEAYKLGESSSSSTKAGETV